MFVAVQPHKAVEDGRLIEKAPGDKLPALSKADLAEVVALVDSGAVKWSGDGGAYGPLTREAVALKAQRAAALALRRSKIKQGDAPAISDAQRIRNAEARAEAAEAMVSSMATRLAALESKAEVSAPAQSGGPSPGAKGGR